nr:MAG TPA: hypothetical protein [Caudoviricetes sp.]
MKIHKKYYTYHLHHMYLYHYSISVIWFYLAISKKQVQHMYYNYYNYIHAQ